MDKLDELEALLPCPFCGGDAAWQEDTGQVGVTFGLMPNHTPGCFLTGILPFDEAIISAKWNARAPEALARQSAEQAARVVALEELAHDMLLDLESTRIFLTTREKMHECGVAMRDDVISRARAALGAA